MIYILNEYLTLFWYALFVNECKPEFQFKNNLNNIYVLFGIFCFIFRFQLVRPCP